MSMNQVRRLTDVRCGDIVRTPAGHLAIVKGVEHEGVLLQRLDDGEEMTLLPFLLTFIERSKPKAFPKGFFSEAKTARA